MDQDSSDDKGSSLKYEFPGYFRDSDEVISRAWDSHVFVFDANILLNFYRYSESARNDFKKIIEKIKDRVWLPNRAAYEYFENRASVIKKQADSYDEVINSIENVRAKLENKYQQPFVNAESFNAAQKTFALLIDDLLKSKELLLDKLNNDEIKNFFADVFEGKVGQGASEDSLIDLVKDGEQRYKDKVPPGYMDAGKGEGAVSIKEKIRKFGDLIFWKQVIDASKKKGVGVILITDDKKEDWWSMAAGRTIGARPELIKEFKKETGQSIYIYKADRFLEFASAKFHEDVSSSAVEELRSIREYGHEYKDDGCFDNLDVVSGHVNDESISGENLYQLRKISIINEIEKLKEINRIINIGLSKKQYPLHSIFSKNKILTSNTNYIEQLNLELFDLISKGKSISDADDNL